MRDSRLGSIVKVTLFISLLTAIVSLLGLRVTVKARENLANVRAFHFADGLVDNLPCSAGEGQQLVESYPALVACLMRASSDDRPEIGLNLLGRVGDRFTDRSALLGAFQARLLAQAESTDLSCQLLSSIPAKPIVVDLADQAYQAGNWLAVDAFLGCLSKIREVPGSVSPYQVAQLYQVFGTYLEGQGELDRAMEAYGLAASWYPTVWADPIIGMARLQAQRNGVEEATQVIARALVDATLPQSIFLLSRQMGFYQLELNDPIAEYCFFSQAQSMTQQLLEAYAPQEWRKDLDARMTSLLSEQLITPPDCSAVLNRYLSTP